MLNKRTLFAVFFCSLVFSVHPLLYGQANGSFSGTVADKTGPVIAGAMVRIASQGTGVVREAKTDESRHYLVPLLPVATYTIRVESLGSQPIAQKHVPLAVAEHRALDCKRAPAS